MLLPDVNIFVHAFRTDTERHSEYRNWIEAQLSGAEPVGVGEAVLASVVRIVTNHRIFREPSPLPLALEFCAAVRGAPAAVVVRPSDRHWELFDRLCRDGGATGNLVPDADLAALAIEHGATLISTDRGMLRWPGLAVRHPLQG